MLGTVNPIKKHDLTENTLDPNPYFVKLAWHTSFFFRYLHLHLNVTLIFN